jgi:GPH family glycoside/pentoside/hexuronide:cation symporter
LPSLTTDTVERTRLATARIAFSFVGAGIVSWFALPMIGLLGHGSNATGIFRTAALFSATAYIMLLLSFFTLRENHQSGKQSTSIRKSLSALRYNRPWIIFSTNILFMWGAFFLQQGALIYFYKYNINRADLIPMFAGITTVVPVFGSLLSIVFARATSKQVLYRISSLLYLSGTIIMILSAADINMLILGNVVSAFGFGFRHSVYFSMQADPVDYGIRKSGIDSSGIIASLNGLIGKIAMAIAGAALGVFLKTANYAPGKLSESSISAIKTCYLYIPALLTVVSITIMGFYSTRQRASLINNRCKD